MVFDFGLMLQTGALLATYITIFLGVFNNWKKKQQDALTDLQTTFDQEVEDMKAEQAKEIEHLTGHISELKVQLANERADRVEKTARVHARIDEMQNEMIGDLRADMSEIKGELKGVSNIMSVVQQWFVNQNNIQKGV